MYDPFDKFKPQESSQTYRQPKPSRQQLWQEKPVKVSRPFPWKRVLIIFGITLAVVLVATALTVLIIWGTIKLIRLLFGGLKINKDALSLYSVRPNMAVMQSYLPRIRSR